MIKQYAVTFRLKSPNEKGRSISLRDKKNDIEYALAKFNARYASIKRLELISADKRSIRLLFEVYPRAGKVNPNGRDLVLFSRILFHECGWKDYSRERAVLFTASEFREIQQGDEYPGTRQPEEKAHDNGRESFNIEIPEDMDIIMNDNRALKSVIDLMNRQNTGRRPDREKRKFFIRLIKAILLKADR